MQEKDILIQYLLQSFIKKEENLRLIIYKIEVIHAGGCAQYFA